MPPFYELQLILFSSVCLVWLLFDRQLSSKRPSEHSAPAITMARLAKQYLIVYAIVMGEPPSSKVVHICWMHDTGADWLQGPYVYSLYREQYAFPERLVAVLFVIGFLSAGLTAPLVGAWADQQWVLSLRSHCLAICPVVSHIQQIHIPLLWTNNIALW